MERKPGHRGRDEELDRELAAVRELLMARVRLAPLTPKQSRYLATMAEGKMLRARLALRIGGVAGTDAMVVRQAAAAAEMIHAATLLHDDVIDGGEIRRGMPAFWVRYGTPGAILLGDLFLCEGLGLARDSGRPTMVNALIELTGAVCRAEVEQELMLRGREADWKTCVGLARRKTGALFAFAAQTAVDGQGPVEALREAGYRLGTAYQLADDLLDTTGDHATAGKTLGTDEGRRKTTAVTAMESGRDRITRTIDDLCREAAGLLADWPDLREAIERYIRFDIGPAIAQHVGMGSPSPAVAAEQPGAGRS